MKKMFKLLNKTKGGYHLFKVFLICFEKCKFSGFIGLGPKASAQKVLLFSNSSPPKEVSVSVILFCKKKVLPVSFIRA